MHYEEFQMLGYLGKT